MEEEARPSKKARRGAGSGLTAFALRLAKRLAVGDADDGGNQNQNLVFSPVSIYTALSLVVAEARGTTLDELLALLGAASRDDLVVFAGDVAERTLADQSGLPPRRRRPARRLRTRALALYALSTYTSWWI